MNAYSCVFTYLANGRFISLIHSAEPHWLPNVRWQWFWGVRIGRLLPITILEAV